TSTVAGMSAGGGPVAFHLTASESCLAVAAAGVDGLPVYLQFSTPQGFTATGPATIRIPPSVCGSLGETLSAEAEFNMTADATARTLTSLFADVNATTSGGGRAAFSFKVRA